MKKLGKGKGRRVYPAPPPRDHLAALPAAVLTLAATLTPEEQEVLAYLLSNGGGGGDRRQDLPMRRAHQPELGCRCFGCYTSFWARWDASPNRHVIHRIIDAVEESLEARERIGGGGGRRRRRSSRGGRKGAGLQADAAVAEEGDLGMEAKGFRALDGGNLADNDDGSSIDDEEEEEEETEEISDGGKSSVGRFMSFIGERVWGVWN